jgi:hypothetical protein
MEIIIAVFLVVLSIPVLKRWCGNSKAEAYVPYDKRLEKLCDKLSSVFVKWGLYDRDKYPVIKVLKSIYVEIMEFKRKERWLQKTIGKKPVTLLSVRDRIIEAYTCVDFVMEILMGFDIEGYIYLINNKDEQQDAKTDVRLIDLNKYLTVFSQAILAMDEIQTYNGMYKRN